MAFESLDIPHYRGLRNLEVKDLRRINMLVGKNNCGKTSLLEAIALLCNLPNTAYLVHYLMKFRNSESKLTNSLGILTQNETEQKHWIQVNGQLKPESNPQLKIRKMGFSLKYEKCKWDYYPSDYEIARMKANGQHEKIDKNWVMYMDYRLETNHSGEKTDSRVTICGPLTAPFTIYVWETEHLQGYSTNEYAGALNYKLLDINHEDVDLASTFDEMIFFKKIQYIIKALSEIDPQIEDLRMMSDSKIFVDLGNAGLMPIEALGEGSRRILNILMVILELPKGGVCLIDEIDTGLHFSALPVMWRAVLQAAESNDVQLFATTHSDECVKSLVEVLREKSEKEDKFMEDMDFALYHLVQSKEGTKAYRQGSDNMETMVELGIEYR